MGSRLSRILGTIALTVFLGACNHGTIYYSFGHLPPGGWNKENILFFHPEVSDTLALYDMYVAVRHNNDYPYSNLWLFVHVSDSAGIIMTDTINIPLAEPSGKWLGSGWGALYQKEALLRGGIDLPAAGIYTVAIQQGMRTDDLTGVTDVGIKVTKHTSDR